MNYFGLFFTFMLPGVLLGIMAAAAFSQERKAKKAKRAAARPRIARTEAVVERGRLYVCDLTKAA